MLKRARARGIPNFHIFGEIHTSDMDPAHTAANTRFDKVPAVMDYAFRRAVVDAIGGGGTDELAKLFRADALYEGGVRAALGNETFVGNYDEGRLAYFIRKALPNIGDAELLQRVELGHAMLLTLRGVPTIYYGDEQGFVGDGGDQDARQDMFASRVASYNDDRLVGTSSTTARANFDTNHPLYRFIGTMARVRTSHPALTRGRQLIRFAAEVPGLFAVSRFDPASGHEMLLLFNASTAPIEQNVAVETRSTRFTALAGSCPAEASAPGSVRISLPPLGYGVCDAR
jgi:glycosidase